MDSKLFLICSGCPKHTLHLVFGKPNPICQEGSTDISSKLWCRRSRYWGFRIELLWPAATSVSMFQSFAFRRRTGQASFLRRTCSRNTSGLIWPTKIRRGRKEKLPQEAMSFPIKWSPTPEDRQAEARRVEASSQGQFLTSLFCCFFLHRWSSCFKSGCH